MQGSIYDCINHDKYVSKKKPTFEKILTSMSKLNTVDNLDADKLRKRISDLKNAVINYLYSKLSLGATENSLSSSATRNLNGTSNQNSIGDKLTEASYFNAATISKHENPTIKSSKHQSNNSNSQIKPKTLVAGYLALNNIRERGLSKQHPVKVKNFLSATTEITLKKLENPLESRPDVLIVYAGTIDLPKNINPLNNLGKVI